MSFEPNLAWWVERGLRDIASVESIEDGLRVTTHCMYPSNGLVSVVVRGGSETVIVSDEGGALSEALSAGIPVKEYGRTLSKLIGDQGLYIKEGVVYTPQLPIAAAAVAVLHVANASQEIARWMFDHMKIKRPRDFNGETKNNKNGFSDPTAEDGPSWLVGFVFGIVSGLFIALLVAHFGQAPSIG